jgi:2-hydroxy-6-oxonona-2,4-dienedioate hydrolase
VRARTLDIDGIATQYFTEGKGVPVALVHGGVPGSPYLAWGAKMWSGTIGALASSFDVIAFDRPGHGETSARLSDDAYTLDHDARHAAALLAAHGNGPYHLVGHGHGGYVAARLAIDHPQLVRTCTIVDSGALAPGANRQYLLADAPQPYLTRESQRWALETYAHHAAPVVDAYLDTAVELAQCAGYLSARAKMVDAGIERRVFAPALARGRLAMYRHFLQSGLSMPTFVIWGLYDRIAPLENGRLLLEALVRKQRRTEMRVINDAGHFVFLEQPEAFVRALASFLR